ncbi:uncharacterized protein K452DRAFT_306062 [Aplosporella prunicola CBS 121167]|uniref:Uncharacterized protein n=1 Tax=Aplosporella prunicola CBS 121167 TaxID=1176127 RepID=A0A6A6BM63_9PEZI|nr:uncharacterized protein K452DRAFT_306062 [Aplosporella prunicola CBS 121167]KAF2145136.1 hypothetical protein K452DRAFT_306062 [Aplosporella prunicola CBS 121167]
MSLLRPTTRLASRFVAPFAPRVARAYSTAPPQYEHLQVSTPQPGVGLVTLNRPKALNALFTPLITELNDALGRLDADRDIGAMVITGSEKAFAARALARRNDDNNKHTTIHADETPFPPHTAGADIKEMKDLTFASAYGTDFIERWSDLTTRVKKPLISAVNGYALGGGCELAMMADILYCSAGATFGQPEIKLGVIPGAGGTQRLTAALGKARAMELILTGANFSGTQAGEWGLAARVFASPAECLDGAVSTAATIAKYSRVAVKAAKEAVNKSQDLGVREGVEFERRLFHGLFGSRDQKIGMTAFAEKKKPEWSNE